MTNQLTKIPKFRRCVLQNFPFIEQDFDALTDYELLCKVVEYLNKVIANENALTESQSNLIIQFNTLKDYVDNYFDNLDVQDEINNKLDEMVEAGTLQEIITSYIQNNVAWTFDTVADMKNATNLIDGSFAQTLGFRSVNDGGGAIYLITDTGTANEMDVIAVGDLYANLILPKIICPAMVGAYADDTHDDSTFIKRAIDLGNDIDLENKTYLVADTIIVDKSDIRIHHGKIHSTATAYVYRLSGNIRNVAIEYHECYGTDPDRTTSQYFIGCLSTSGNNFKNIKVQYNIAHNMNAGISINADLGGDFKDVYIAHNIVYDMYGITPGKGYGIHVANGSNTFTNTVIEDNEIYHCERHCLYTARGRGYILRGNFIHNNIDEVYAGGYKPAVNLSRSRDITFENNTIKDCINGMLYFASELQPDPGYELESYPCININIINNIFEGNTNLAAIAVGYAETPKCHAQNINILNNKFNTTGYIGLYACENVRIDSNNFSASPDYCIIIYGGTNQTVTTFTRDIYITNNMLIAVGTHRPIRLQTLFTDNNAYLLLENNLTNFEKFIVTQSNVKNTSIQLVNQAWNSDFTFDGSSTFMPYTINGVEVTS